MMKIICTVTNDLSQDQRMIRICGTLQDAGYEVTLVGRLRPTSLPLTEQRFKQKRLKCWFEAGKLFYLEYNLRLFVLLLFHEKFAAVNAIDLDTLLPAYLASRLRGVVCIYDAHEYFTEVPEVVRRPAVKKMWSALADWIIPQLKYAYTVGPALARLMGEQYGVSFDVVRNVPVRRAPIENFQAGGKKIILYQGMLNEGRGLEAAIKALKHLSPEFELMLVGSGDIQKQLRQLAEDEGVLDQVTFKGFVAPKYLPEITNHAWLGLNLLEPLGLSYYYSLANKAFDYIQAGKPSMQMNFPEYQALQLRYEPFLLLDSLEPATLAKKIMELANAPDVYEQLRQNCLRAAQELNWEMEKEHLLRIYNVALS